MDSAKQKIKQCVSSYKKLFPDDYKLVVKGIEMQRKMLKNDYAEIEGMSTEMRGAYELPEDLSNMFTTTLDEEEMKWLKIGGKNGHEGLRWFQKTFPEFNLPKVI